MFAKWVVTHNVPFTAVETKDFRRILHHYTPDLPSLGADALRNFVLKSYEKERKNIGLHLQKHVPGKINIAHDLWSSPNDKAILGIVGFYVNEDFDLKRMVLDFVEMKGQHSGVNVAEHLIDVLDSYGILEKVL